MTTTAQTPVSMLLLTAARIVENTGCAPAEAVGHILSRMAAERPALLGKTLAELAQHPEIADRLHGLMA